MKKRLCIYHGNCIDGFTAAWVIKQFSIESGLPFDFFPGVYRDDPPEIKEYEEVYLVDFSYKRAVMETLLKEDIPIYIIDHHKSAIADLDGLKEQYPKLTTYFDIERSGAMLTWDWFFTDLSKPPLIGYVQDRDLWQYKLINSKEVNAAIFSYEYSFANWDKLVKSKIGDLVAEGEPIIRKHFKDVKELLAVCQREMNIDGLDIPVASLPYTLSSDAGHIMAAEEGVPYAACYWDTPKHREFSLRSSPNGLDVSEIAVAYGGGGHKHASGFHITFAEMAEMPGYGHTWLKKKSAT